MIVCRLGAVAAGLVAWAVASSVLGQGLPAGIVLLGIVLGAVQALTAVGIVLVYRASRVINFAQAELGALGGVLAIELVLRWRVGYLWAAMAGVTAAMLVGVVIDAVVMRRFRRAPRLVVAVVTIGMGQVLAGLSLLLPGLIEGDPKTARFPTPFDASFEIAPVVFNGNHLVAVVAVAAVSLVLRRFLSTSHHGVAMRAVADDAERAGYLGIPAGRLTAIAWGLAGGLSALAVLLRTPMFAFSTVASVSGGGPGLLLRALAAAVIGRMENLPRTVLAALALGVLDSAAMWAWASTTYVDAVLGALIVVSLLLQRRAGGTGNESLVIRQVRPIPAELAVLPELRWSRCLLPWTGLAAAALMPLVLSPAQEFAAGLVFIYAILAVSLVVLIGWTGHISLGQFALAGLGGTTTALLYQRHGWDFFAALPTGISLAAAGAVLLGLPALRLPGPFLAVTTLGFATASASYVLEARYFPWLVQETLDRPALWGRLPLEQDWQMYLACLVGLVAVLVVIRSLRASRTGRVTIAVRDNPRAAQAAAVAPLRVQLRAFALSGALAGFAGSLYVVHQRGLATETFTPEAGMRLFSMAVIGGLGSVPGAILGAVYIRGTELLLAPGWALLTTGVGVVVLLMFLPEGLGGLLYRCRDAALRALARRRGIEVPSLVADRHAAAPVDPQPIPQGVVAGAGVA